MKPLAHILLTIIATFCHLAASSQEATVKSVTQDATDISAAKYQRKDLNGIPCALVKVQVIANDVQFFGNIVGDTEYRAGEYWVYLTDGTKMFRIQSGTFLPVTITFPDHGIPSLSSNCTYTVTLTLPGANQSTPNAGFNYLILNINPGDAKVTVDGKPREVKNGTAKILLRNGTYRYHVESIGYLPEDGEVTIDNARAERTVTLKSTKGTFTITTTTPGTDIYINGEKIGSGTWTGSLLPDTYSIEGRLAGYRDAQLIETIGTGESRTVTIPALTPILGALNIDYEPTGASITIDGKSYGHTPNVINDLTTGTHTVTISKEGYDTANLTATVAENELNTLSGKLTESQKVFQFTEEEAHFPGGEAAMYRWLSTNLKYPREAAEENIQGRVVVQFAIEKDGSISNATVIRGRNPYLDAEALRLVNTMPKFIPAKMNGVPVKVTFTLPITFRLQTGDEDQKSK